MDLSLVSLSYQLNLGGKDTAAAMKHSQNVHHSIQVNFIIMNINHFKTAVKQTLGSV